jgi:uncharacterized MAPEG superfamily protein
MTTPVLVLLAFAGWTLLTLLATVGVYRWSRILTGRVAIAEWNSAVAQGDDWYQRAMRAHANCLENLPVYGAVVVAIVATGADSPRLDLLAVVVLAARMIQTVVHVGFTPTNAVASARFAFFFTQIVCMFWMGIWVVTSA